MAQADRLAIAAGVPGIELMENAGRAVADAIGRDYPQTALPACVVAGPGNNGGDGFVAARLLAARGMPVRMLLLGDRARLKGDAAEAARRWQGGIVAATPDALSGCSVIVDALFGAGLDRPVEGPAAVMIEAMNAAGVPIVAVDLPSGVNGSSGAVMGSAVRAATTVTFFRRKLGHVLMPGRLHCGTVEVADIGIPASVLDRIQPRAWLNGPQLWGTVFPIPAAQAHKYARGHAVVVSGGLSFTGAARLAARGALRAGAGLVTIASPRDALAVHAVANEAVMVRAVDGAAELSALLSDRRLNAIALGPGGGVGQPMRDMVRAALASGRAVVLDADALTSFAEAPEALFLAIHDRGTAKAAHVSREVVLTPHEGEFIRLFGKLSYLSDKSSKSDMARAAAAVSGAIVLLKGPDTVVAAPDGRVAVADNAPPWLATAGAGDVLTGMVAGLLAQGMPAFLAAAAAVWVHGEAGHEAGPGLIAEDLPDVLPRVYRRLFSELAKADRGGS
ncbi:MAG TPA: NAD(P)H-hydrate dehydratase [Xanthobacteraceae bacterium]|nr:NAD(P)H-hydrate dehydratase [Xanthobacteraceae bacterium]